MNCQELTGDNTDNNYQAYALSSPDHDLSGSCLPYPVSPSRSYHIPPSPRTAAARTVGTGVLYEMLHGLLIKPAEAIWRRDRNIAENVINWQKQNTCSHGGSVV